MDLRQLRYFSVLAETLNFHRAAERLNISQPPLTVAIRKLERQLGTTLFERGARGVRLTAAGAGIVDAVHAALAAAEDVRALARQGAAGVTGRLSIGFIGSATGELLPRIVSPFRDAYPDVELALEEMNSVEIVRAIAARRIDVGLVRLPVMDSAEVAIHVAERDELFAAVPTAFAAADGPIDLARLSDEPFIMAGRVSVLHATIRLACQRKGFIPRVAQEAVQVQTMLSLVEAGLGVALVPSRTARFAPRGVRLIPLADPVPIEMGLAWAHSPAPVVRNFIAFARSIVDSQKLSNESR